MISSRQHTDGDGHSHDFRANSRKSLWTALALIASFMLVEIVGGVILVALYFSVRQAVVRLKSLEQARVVLRNNRIRRQVGDMTRAEELQAASVVAQREGNYFTALRDIQDAEDALWLKIDRSGQSRLCGLNISTSLLIGVVKRTADHGINNTISARRSTPQNRPRESKIPIRTYVARRRLSFRRRSGDNGYGQR